MIQMIYLYANRLKELDQQNVGSLLELIGLDKNLKLDAFTLGSDDYTFYEFFYDSVPNCIIFDWKWSVQRTIDEVVKKIEKIEPKIPDVRHIFNAVKPESYSSGSPDILFEELNQHSKGMQFIHIDLGDDTYYYLAAPRNIDLNVLCSITGLQVLSQTSQAPVLTTNDINKVQTKKIFFAPIQNGEAGSSQSFNWYGRILPGQTIREGVAEELRNAESFRGSFSIESIEFKDFDTDNHGKQIPRYWIKIRLNQ